jgi:hypothetical protein
LDASEKDDYERRRSREVGAAQDVRLMGNPEQRPVNACTMMITCRSFMEGVISLDIEQGNP